MSVQEILEAGVLTQIHVIREARTFILPIAGGEEREKSFLPSVDAAIFSKSVELTDSSLSPKQLILPILLGAGAGFALAELVSRLEAAFGPDFSLVVVDKEADILSATGVRQRFSSYAGIHWVSSTSSEEALCEITRIQQTSGIQKFFPIAHPLYLRMHREYYAAVRKACEEENKADFWSQANYPKFTSANPPRVLLLTSAYFLMGEVIESCKRLGIPYRLLQIPSGELAQGVFIEQLLSMVLEFKPDFAFTINHLGVDREGVLVDLLAKLRLPLASWFVDNPHLILSLYTALISPWTYIFTWDVDNVKSLRALGFEHVDYLPLGTDITRFTARKAGFGANSPLFSGLGSSGSKGGRVRPKRLPEAWPGKVSFVGNSMVYKVESRKNRSRLPKALCDGYRNVAAGFSIGEERSVESFLASSYPDLLPYFISLEVEDRIGYETMLTWEATLQYRLDCVRSMLPYAPLLVGDAGWHTLLGKEDTWFYHDELSYYDDLPTFYPCSCINFNCTSKQMKGAVNQRVFDVPATNSFILTDYREQIENLFDLGKEVICYSSPEEATELAARYLAAPKEREAVAAAAYRRVHAEHSYDQRMLVLLEHMRKVYK